MTRSTNSMDGFIPRRPGAPLNRHQQPNSIDESVSRLQPLRPPESTVEAPVLTRQTNYGLTRADVDESLKDIDDESPKRGSRKGGLASRRPRSLRKMIKMAALMIGVVLLGVGGFVGYKALIASGNILKGNVLGLVQSDPLKQDGSGWTHALLLGTSEDDPGHGGAYLTDSMMVVSVNQNEKKASMFSIPRDLYVKYGMACNSGYQGKINEYFNCVNSDWDSKEAENERLEKTREFIGEIFGLDIQYVAHLNNTVLKQAVDAVGGVDVNIEGSGGAPGILDRNFDWRCNYKCYYVKYDNGMHHLDGEHALFLAMARGDIDPTYGLGNSNFDREKNQQKIILALKEKAISTGTLTNIGSVTGLIDALGENLRTNVATNEIRTVMKLGLDIKPESIVRISLNDADKPMVHGANYNGASVVVPVAGVFKYDALRTYIKQQMNASPVTREGAAIAVFNGSGVAGAAQTEADKLSEDGLDVTQVDNAPDGTYAPVTIYQRGDGMPATKEKLESIYGVKVKSNPPVPANGNINFIIIIGKKDEAS